MNAKAWKAIIEGMCLLGSVIVEEIYKNKK